MRGLERCSLSTCSFGSRSLASLSVSVYLFRDILSSADPLTVDIGCNADAVGSVHGAEGARVAGSVPVGGRAAYAGPPGVHIGQAQILLSSPVTLLCSFLSIAPGFSDDEILRTRVGEDYLHKFEKISRNSAWIELMKTSEIDLEKNFYKPRL